MAIALTYPADGAVFVAGGGVVGNAVVRKLAAAGLPVVFGYLNQRERAQALGDELRAQGMRVQAERVDLTDSDSVREALQGVEQRYGRLHTVIYAAGPTLAFQPIRELAPERMQQFLLGDTMGCYRLFHHAIPLLVRGGGGSLTACATMANQRVIDNDALSSMPKAAIEALVRQIAAEEAPRGVRANAIGIGWIGGWATSFEEARAACAQMPLEVAATVSPMIEQMISLIRMQRPGAAGEAADLIAYLASDQASYVTGRTVALDGGASL